jgi:hypothetical protein
VSNIDSQVVIGGSVTFATGASNTTAKIYCYARIGSGYGWCDDMTLRKQ